MAGSPVGEDASLIAAELLGRDVAQADLVAEDDATSDLTRGRLQRGSDSASDRGSDLVSNFDHGSRDIGSDDFAGEKCSPRDAADDHFIRKPYQAASFASGCQFWEAGLFADGGSDDFIIEDSLARDRACDEL